ncbi:MAG: hypothetical protein LBO72_07295 [Helicobacteraceae bacterium]|nr:hypothetical protein [Helicobacteraceae bacterium]
MRRESVTIDDIAVLADISVEQAKRLLKGDFDDLSISKLNKIAVLLDRTLDFLLFGADSAPTLCIAKIALNWREMKVIAAMRAFDFIDMLERSEYE